MRECDVNFMYMIEKIMCEGSFVDTRNSTTKRLRNLQTTYTQTPLVTVRCTAWKNALREMEWFLSGSSNINDLHEKVRHWWQPWADKKGIIQNNYSKQFREFQGTGINVDQINYLKNAIQKHPYSRRSVITTWNTADMIAPFTPITNCHGTVIQAFVEPADNSLHLTMYQRSSDMVLGLPHNLIQYWAFLMYLAHRGERSVGSFTWIGGDCHIYEDHFDLVDEMSEALKKAPKNEILPALEYNPTDNEFKADDFSLDIKYKPLLKKPAKMIV